MKRYRSKLKGPLPVGLKSGSISVASKGYFNVDGDDETSPDLLTKVRQNKVELIEETVTIEVPSEPVPVSEPKPDPVIVQPPNIPADVIEDEKDDDSLTSSSEMVESEGEETGSDDAKSADEPKESKKKKKRVRGGKTRTNKKGISG